MMFLYFLPVLVALCLGDRNDSFIVKELNATKGQIIKTIKRLSNEYSISLFIKLTNLSHELSNVLHLTTSRDQYGFHNILAIYFLRDILKICNSFNERAIDCFQYYHFPLNVWTNVTVVYSRTDLSYWYTVYINETQTEKLQNKYPQFYNNVQVYASDPWYPPFNGTIKDLKVSIKKGISLENVIDNNGNVTYLFRNIYLQQNRLLKTIPILPKENNVTLNVKLHGISLEWTNVIHLTTEDDRGVYGYRIPGLFFNGDRLYICSAVSNNSNYCVFFRDFPINKWIEIRIINRKVDTAYWHIVYVDNKLMDMVLNLNPQDFHDVKIYGSDAWHLPFTGEVSNLTITFKDPSLTTISPSTASYWKGNCSLGSYSCLDNQYQPGNTNMVTFHSVTVQQCAFQCCQHPLCVGFDYTGELSRCYLSRHTRKQVDLRESKQRTIQCEKTEEATQYKIMKTRLTWLGAESECQKEGSHLVTISTSKQNHFLVNEMSKMEIKAAWIGYNDRFREGVFEWVIPFKSVGFTSWGADGANGSTWEDCVEVGADGRWADAPCHHEKAFICQKSTGVLSCGENTTSHVGILTSPRYPNDYPSNHTCTTYIQVPMGKYVQLTIQEMDIQREASCLSDYVEIYNDDDHKTPAIHITNTILGKYCGRMRNVNLFTRLNAGARIVFKTDNDTTGPGFRISWTVKGGSDAYRPAPDKMLYKFYRREREWFAAKAQCEKDGAQLTIDDNEKTHQYITREYGLYNMWLGATDIREEGNWVWVTGQPINDTQTHWERGHKEPNGGVLENCLNTNQQLPGDWNDVSCDYKLPFLCQKGPGTAVVKPTGRHPYTGRTFTRHLHANTTGSFYLRCGSDATTDTGVIVSPNYPYPYPINGACTSRIVVAAHKYIHLTIVFMDVEWNAKCLLDYVEISDTKGMLGKYCGRLSNVTLNTMNNIAIIKFFSDGFVSRSGFEISWIAKDQRCVGPNRDCCTPSTPCNIRQGDCDSDEDCIGNLTCGNNNCAWGGNYDCCTTLEDAARRKETTRKASTSIPTTTMKVPEQTQPVTSWITREKQDLNFRFGGSQYMVEPRRMVWDHAEESCEEWGGHLVTINSDLENFVLTSKLYHRQLSSAWIGFSDRKEEDKFEWIVPCRKCYTNWQTSEPNGGINEDCVELVSSRGHSKEGDWNDLTCHGELPSICEKPILHAEKPFNYAACFIGLASSIAVVVLLYVLYVIRRRTAGVALACTEAVPLNVNPSSLSVEPDCPPEYTETSLMMPIAGMLPHPPAYDMIYTDVPSGVVVVSPADQLPGLPVYDEQYRDPPPPYNENPVT